MNNLPKTSTGFAATVAILLPAFMSNVFAHHSFAIFAIEHKISLTGVVTDIRFVSPHITMQFETTRANGTTEVWDIESMAPFRWDNFGHDRDFIKVGDIATFYGWPARNCSNAMALSAIETEAKGTMVITPEIRQGRAREAIPDETDICDSWPE